MTRLQSDLRSACKTLGLSAVIPFTRVFGGTKVEAQALIPQLGAPEGMIIVGDYQDLKGRTSDIVHAGYGYSVLSEPPPQEEYDLNSYMELFLDWGWCGPEETKPAWIQTQG